MWSNRFLTDTWAWELPMGLIEPGESPAKSDRIERVPMGEVMGLIRSTEIVSGITLVGLQQALLQQLS